MGAIKVQLMLSAAQGSRRQIDERFAKDNLESLAGGKRSKSCPPPASIKLTVPQLSFWSFRQLSTPILDRRRYIFKPQVSLVRLILGSHFLIGRPRFVSYDALMMQTPLDEETWANQMHLFPNLSQFLGPHMGSEGAEAG